MAAAATAKQAHRHRDKGRLKYRTTILTPTQLAQNGKQE